MVPFGLQTPKVTLWQCPRRNSEAGPCAGTVMLKTMVEALTTVATTLGSAAMLLLRTRSGSRRWCSRSRRRSDRWDRSLKRSPCHTA